MNRSYTFPGTHRLRSKLDFARVFDARVREYRGPVTLYALPNELPHPRMGISMSRKVGTAARRNRIKRLLRESFRLHQHDLPRGYDFVVTVRPHEPMILAEYQKIMMALMLKLHAVWQRRGSQQAPPKPPPEAPTE
jgi:ribonuclease P protein component